MTELVGMAVGDEADAAGTVTTAEGAGGWGGAGAGEAHAQSAIVVRVNEERTMNLPRCTAARVDEGAPGGKTVPQRGRSA